jgi:uncharacterized protein
MMKEYLRWSLRQLYLVFFWPTRFGRKVEGVGRRRLRLGLGKRFRYLLKMLPWIVMLAVFLNVVAGYACEAAGADFSWGRAWIAVGLGVAIGVAIGLIMGVAFGSAVGVVVGVVIGVVVGVMGAVAFGVASGAAYNVAYGVAVFVAVGVAGAAMGGVALGMADGMGGLTRSVVVGLGSGVLVGILGSLAIGLAGGAISMLVFWLTCFRLIVYPFDVVLAGATYYVGRWRPQVARRAWRWCPVAWNEMIWLPLPFVSKLLALLVRQDRNRKKGLKRIAFVAAERRLQRRAARAALVEVAITDLRAGSMTRLYGVATRLDWTRDESAKLPDELAATLPRFDRAAQHARQYRTLGSPYRKREALARAINETESLQRSLIVARGRYAPRLLQVANEWRRLLDGEIEKAKALAAARREIPNPFVFGSPVAETEQNVFTGRRDIVRQIETSVLGAQQTPTLLLHGPRRMGKTSILNQLPLLLGPDFAPTVVDCQNPAVTESGGTLLRYISRGMSEGLRRRRVAVEPLAAATLARVPYVVFDEWLDTVECAMPKGMRALLCLDEYERLQATLKAGWGGSFLDALRHTLQHRPRVVLMFTGAHTFQELGPAWTDRFISARRVRVSFLKPEEVLPLLTQPIPEFDMTYAPGALDAIIMATSCQPFLTQAVAFELVQLLNEQERKQATPADVEAAIDRALVSGGEYFANVWSDARAEGQAVLRAIALDEAPPEFLEALAWLREHDVLTGDGQFAVEMVRRWVKNKAS